MIEPAEDAGEIKPIEEQPTPHQLVEPALKEQEPDVVLPAAAPEDGKEKPFQFTSFEEIQRVIIGDNNDYDRGFMQNFVRHNEPDLVQEA